ncbi:P-loop containing nucleoside triphosphate hydrolase protein [Calocera cornea HHB12733]|uniref:p-loop containing nucleoside triphosphate hydrolase protein n=1 Tax=Calocera cornea HHB12733 TaxID=1353952 RepID=A0A165HDS3_9BASI|nr:P-loop containing nucleoside triphosphate hydrolase protein [Calocera cornea HHB12733]
MNAVRPLASYASLTIAHKKALEKGGFGDDPSSVLLWSPQEVAKRLRLTPQQVLDLTDSLAKDLTPKIRKLDETEDGRWFTTGDARIDAMMGGGVCTGQIYDVCGEAASGKTQLALQLALFVQLPAPHGLSGSTAYITTTTRLPTDRLTQIKSAHPSLSILDDKLALDHLHTSTCKTPEMLIHTLTYPLRRLAQSIASSLHPIRLLIIDSLAWLFRTESDKGLSSSLFERSKFLSHIASLLRGLARDFGLAVVVLNHVSTIFDNDRPPQPAPASQTSSSSSQSGSQQLDQGISYRDQSRWFGSSGPGTRYEAALGLVWANEVNARLMLSRTHFRHYFETEEGRPAKRRRTNGGDPADRAEDYARVRRLDLIFHPDAPPANLDFIVTAAGIKSISDAELATRRKPTRPTMQPHPSSDPTVPLEDMSGITAEELARYAEAMDYRAEDDNEDDLRALDDEKGPDPDVTGVDEQALSALDEREEG